MVLISLPGRGKDDNLEVRTYLRINKMQKGHTLQFKCLSCGSPVTFSIFDLDIQAAICCHGCEKKYAFTDPTLIRQLKKFEALCRQIQDSEEILGAACVGVDVGEHHVKVPYKLLLTRLSSSLDLNMAGHKVSIFFRIEPARDIPTVPLLRDYSKSLKSDGL